ncbi:MAG: hypothetical protein C0458_21805 [Methylobacterium sp.]|nr:hypothetical protein [Methylobacterium sp.]
MRHDEIEIDFLIKVILENFVGNCFCNVGLHKTIDFTWNGVSEQVSALPVLEERQDRLIKVHESLNVRGTESVADFHSMLTTSVTAMPGSNPAAIQKLM